MVFFVLTAGLSGTFSNLLIPLQIGARDMASRKVQCQISIILYNDDFNTFDHVIETLINVCDHTPLQAEQCTLIVHYKGKCS